MTDPAQVYGLAVQAAAEHIQALRKGANGGRIQGKDIEGLVSLLRALAPKAKAGRPAMAGPSSKPVRDLLEDAARQFPELREAMEHLGGGK